MKNHAELEQLAKDQYADYMAGNPLDDNNIESYESTIDSLTPEERKVYNHFVEKIHSN